MSNAEKKPRVVEPKYGRLLNDFRVGEIYHHPWEVTIDEGMLAMFREIIAHNRAGGWRRLSASGAVG